MILSLFRKTRPDASVAAVYNAIVAQSRREVFYAQWDVPDTLTGRFDMISLHLALLFRRLRHEGPEAKKFSQAVFDFFFLDMDRSLREMGVGDLSVGKRIEKMGTLFYGLLASLAPALEAGDEAGVRAVLARNLHEDRPEAATDALLSYVLAADRGLAAQSSADLMAGRIQFGEPQ